MTGRAVSTGGAGTRRTTTNRYRQATASRNAASDTIVEVRAVSSIEFISRAISDDQLKLRERVSGAPATLGTTGRTGEKNAACGKSQPLQKLSATLE